MCRAPRTIRRSTRQTSGKRRREMLRRGKTRPSPTRKRGHAASPSWMPHSSRNRNRRSVDRKYTHARRGHIIQHHPNRLRILPGSKLDRSQTPIEPIDECRVYSNGGRHAFHDGVEALHEVLIETGSALIIPRQSRHHEAFCGILDGFFVQGAIESLLSNLCVEDSARATPLPSISMTAIAAATGKVERKIWTVKSRPNTKDALFHPGSAWARAGSKLIPLGELHSRLRELLEETLNRQARTEP